MSIPPKKEIILIIDDNEQNRYTFGRYLRHNDFEIWTAGTGREGWELAQRNPSLIMLDIQLPDTTGYELCRTIKADPRTASIPVLHTSATFTESIDKAHGLEGGADGYLTQPIDAAELSATVRSLLRVRAAEVAAKNLALQWQTTFDSISDALCLVNPDGLIERFNRAFAALVAGKEEVRVGVPFQKILTALSPANAPELGQAHLPTELLIHERWFRLTSDVVKDDWGIHVANAWVFSDINTIRQAEMALQDVNQQLENRVAERTISLQDAVHQLEQFSYTISHDLRAPLRAMQGYSTALLEDYATTFPADAVDYLTRISTNAARLDKMIVDVLTFTKVSKATPKLEPLPLQKVVQDVVDHYPGLKSPQAKITVDVPHSVLANESGMTQVLSNLLGNAVKFVAHGVTPEIRVWSEAKGPDVRLWVEDNGIGILPEYQKRLFGMFERVLPNQAYEGTGVGLAIARKVVERMNGTVGMESDGVRGSKFWMQLPGAPTL